jgi:hypothetical protein
MVDLVDDLRGNAFESVCNANENVREECLKGNCNCVWYLRQQAADEIERLREALRTIADGDTPREHAIVYRSDGVHSKHDKCKHGAWMYDGCEDCVTEYAIAALGEGKE